ncbi:hypothetical protein PoB_001266600 [Plakobranchus ocellatus]|uniref:Uncharacterized protein n=1 Tax=Plakobranchus ocellatus TaxID=259542 RepID=A0AAV3YS29_9GAST|nr:hypothetical protein PoB_001266600 [Plakobranchus ocellatus]
MAISHLPLGQMPPIHPPVPQVTRARMREWIPHLGYIDLSCPVLSPGLETLLSPGARARRQIARTAGVVYPSFSRRYLKPDNHPGGKHPTSDAVCPEIKLLWNWRANFSFKMELLPSCLRLWASLSSLRGVGGTLDSESALRSVLLELKFHHHCYSKLIWVKRFHKQILEILQPDVMNSRGILKIEARWNKE